MLVRRDKLKTTGEVRNVVLPGDEDVGVVSTDEVEKTRRDLMLARLESVRVRPAAVQGSGEKPKQAAVADRQDVPSLAATRVTLGHIRPLRAKAMIAKSDRENALLNEIMAEIVRADIAALRRMREKERQEVRESSRRTFP